jgi:hypothetical protein
MQRMNREGEMDTYKKEKENKTSPAKLRAYDSKQTYNSILLLFGSKSNDQIIFHVY